MKKLTPVVIVAILALGSLLACKPHASSSKSTGRSMGSAGLAEGADTEAFIQALQKNDFEMIEGKNFQQILPGDTQYRGYEGLVALRDTTTKSPNEFVVGVGSGTVMWFKSHDISGDDAIADWEAHVQKRIALVERLAANKQ
jgi:hypothetical protein